MTNRIVSPFGPRTTAAEVAKGHDLTGKIVVITGGASGIGLETARVLAGAGATVVVAARDTEAAARALADVKGDVSVLRLDLVDLGSVRAFAAAWGDRPINILINNAGVMDVGEGHSAEGVETHLATNHLGHFLLTRLLSGALQKGAPSRVVTVSSSAHHISAFDFEDPNFNHRPYSGMVAYGQSKTANALFSLELDRRGRTAGVRAFSLMPGVIRTRLMRNMSEDQLVVLEQRLSYAVKTIEQGASTTVWAAIGSELEGRGGLYLEDCAQAEPARADVAPRGLLDYANDPAVAERLWAWSRDLTDRTATGAIADWAK